ncbi:MAG: hypothetical protein K2H64_02980 [Desulfovibrio sp.]|nr:hypothetical protein [Desulfovibrio sp.]
MSKCLDDLRKHYNRGFSDEEITDIFNEAEQLYQQVQAAQQVSNQSAYAQKLAQQQTTRDKIALALKKRNTYMQMTRKVAILENALGDWQGREAEGLLANLVGGNKLRNGARLSVDQIRNAVKGQYLGGLFTDIARLGEVHTRIFNKGVMDKDIARAMWTINNPKATPYQGPREAMDLAKIIHKWQEKARIDENRVGGFIASEPGYIVRQSHDMDKIGAAGFQQWKADIEGKLDWTKTANGKFDPNLNPGVTLADRDAWLEQIYRNLSTGIHLKLESANPLASVGKVGSTAAQVSAERVLHFIDGANWYDYNAKYGVGSVGDAAVRGLMRAADKYALMSVLGPSPRANLENMIKSLQTSLNNRGDIRAAERFKNKLEKIWDNFDYLDGTANIPAHRLGAQVSRNIRAIQSMAKLGGAVISALSDVPIFATEMAFQGKGFSASLLRGLSYAISGRGTLEQRRIMSSCGVFCDSLVGDLLARFSGADGPGAMSKMMNLYFKINGLSLWTDSWKKAATLMMAHDFAFIRNTAFKNLKVQEQRLFKLYGIDEGQWDMWRKGATTFADNREYLTPDAVSSITDAEIKSYLQSKGTNLTDLRVKNFREQLADRLRTMFRDRVQYAVIEPDARTNATITQGKRPGTWSGEAWRFAMQFKSFPVAFLQRPFQREFFGRGADTIGGGLKDAGLGALKTLFFKNGQGESSNLGRLILMTTAFGYMSMTIKQLLAGKTPRDYDDLKTWLAAAVQGGGLGIYGDFLFGKQSRTGGTLASTLGGPTYSTAEDMLNLYYKIRDGEDVGANAFRVFFNLMPGNNLFFTRAALDYFIVNPMYECLNPGYLRRMRSRIRKETGQTFWHDPANRR